MLDQSTIAAAEALFDSELVARRRAEYEAVCARQIENRDAVAAAEATMKAAKAARAELLERVARGEAVTPQETLAAEQAIRDSDTRVAFLHEATAAIDREWRRAHDVLAAANHDAAVPIVAHAAARRIAAAERRDVLLAELAAAERDYDTASEIAQHAVGRGFRPRHPLVPSSRRPSLYEQNALQTVRLDASAERTWWRSVGIAVAAPVTQSA
jgi:hypothetical protein